MFFFLYHNSSAQQVDSTGTQTTLDSLQGNWVLQGNASQGLQFMGDTLLYSSNNQVVDGGILVINSTQPDSSDLFESSDYKNEQNGKFLTVQTSVTRNYTIKSVTDSQLILIENGDMLTYIRQ